MGFNLPVVLGDALVLESNPRFAHAATMRPSPAAAYRFDSNAPDGVNQARALSVDAATNGDESVAAGFGIGQNAGVVAVL